MCTALCAKASDLGFEVEVNGNTVTVTPSVADETYFCAAVDKEDIEFISSFVGKEISTAQDIFAVAISLFRDNIFTGTATLDCKKAGEYVVVMCSAQKAEKIEATGEITTKTINIAQNAGDGDEPSEALSFSHECSNDGFTITPSNDTLEYYIGVFSPTLLRQMETFSTPLDRYLSLQASNGRFVDHTTTGTSVRTQADYEVKEDGLYIVAVVGVRSEGDMHIITSPVYQFEWNLVCNTTGIRDIETPTLRGKVLQGGKIIVNGSVLIDGTLVK